MSNEVLQWKVSGHGLALRMGWEFLVGGSHKSTLEIRCDSQNNYVFYATWEKHLSSDST